jgi:hypothetical protein
LLASADRKVLKHVHLWTSVYVLCLSCVAPPVHVMAKERVYTSVMAAHDTLLVGDEMGVIKVLQPDREGSWDKAAVSCKDGDMDKSQAIQCLARPSRPADQIPNWVAAGRINGIVTVHDASTCASLHTVQAPDDDGSPVVSVAWAPASTSGSMQPPLLVAHESGNISLHFSEDWQVREVCQAGSGLACCDLHSDGARTVSGGKGSEPGVHDIETGAQRTIS